jgi:hypothetical protein
MGYGRKYSDKLTEDIVDSHSFLGTWLAFKVRKCTKEALKGPDR